MSKWASGRRAPQGSYSRMSNRFQAGTPSKWMAATAPENLDADHVWCEACHRVVKKRKDGTIRAHRNRSGGQCIGAAPRTPPY